MSLILWWLGGALAGFVVVGLRADARGRRMTAGLRRSSRHERR